MATNKKEVTENEISTQDDQIVEAELDLENLDLEVEAIDERISPSETNGFDK